MFFCKKCDYRTEISNDMIFHCSEENNCQQRLERKGLWHSVEDRLPEKFRIIIFIPITGEEKRLCYGYLNDQLAFVNSVSKGTCGAKYWMYCEGLAFLDNN